MKDAYDLFETELTARGVAFETTDEEGVYSIRIANTELSVSLHNVGRTYVRDEDPEAIVHFVEEILRATSLPSWPEAQDWIYFSAEAADHDFGDTIHHVVTADVAQVLVVMNPRGGSMTWLTPDTIEDWGTTRSDVESAARANLRKLLDGLRPQVEEIDGIKLGMIPVDSPLKASVIFAPNFKEFASQEHDWPVLAVIPCRDFIYILSEKDADLLKRMGGVVQQEYRESGYPITTEILRISDDGIEAIGAFPK